MFTINRNVVAISALVIMIGIVGYMELKNPPKTADQPAFNVEDNGDITSVLTPPGNTSAKASKDAAAADTSANSAVTDAGAGDITIATSDPALAKNSAGTAGGQAITSAQNAAPPADNADVAVPANAPVGSNSGSGNGAKDPGQAVFVSQSTDDSYFVQAKLDREQARSKEENLLMGMINDTNLAQDKRAACADSLLTIQQRIEKETVAEAMIESKGFKNVYVRIDDTTVDVVVDKAALTDAEIAQIQDIVTRKTGYEASKIRISPMKNPT